MHLIGHGLGAHIASYVGSTIKSVAWISGNGVYIHLFTIEINYISSL